MFAVLPGWGQTLTGLVQEGRTVKGWKEQGRQAKGVGVGKSPDKHMQQITQDFVLHVAVHALT